MKIRKFDISDSNLAKLGLVLRNEKCRKIIIILTEKEMYVSQIAKELKIGINIVSDQLKILRELNLVDVTRKPIKRRCNDHNFYRMKNDIFVSIVPEENKMKRIFKDGIKFASIAIVAVFSGLVLIQEKISNDVDIDLKFYNVDNLVLPLIIIIIGLNIILFFEKRKKW